MDDLESATQPITKKGLKRTVIAVAFGLHILQNFNADALSDSLI